MADPVQETDAPESEAKRAERMAIIEAFAAIIKDKRKEAIEGRAASGIEEIWQEDLDHYDGQDDASRGTTSKGRNTSDGLTESRKKSQTRSTVFLKITRPYCDAAAARVADMLLPTDDRNWALKPTPLPELVAGLKDARPVDQVIPIAPQPAQPSGVMGAIRSMFGGGQQQQPQPAPQQPATPTVADLAQNEMDQAKDRADAAQKQIDDWLVECRYHAEVRKVIEDAARLGTGILKGPVPGKQKNRNVTQTPDGGWAIEMVEEIKPTSKAISVWKFYPDPNCGDNIHKGAFTWEEDDITARGLSDLKGVPGYVDEMIDLCLEEGPCSPTTGTRKNKEGEKTKEKDLFQIWYFHGQVSSKDMQAAGCEPGDQSFYPCVVTMVNDRVIKVTLSALDSGEFPYDVMVWQPKPDHWAGVGVSRQMRECQRGANAAVRNLMDNAGLGAGPQIIVDRSKIVPANGKWEIVPRKIWWTKDGAEVADTTKAFTIAEVPMLLDQLMPLLQFWLKEAEDVTGMPMLLQGQQGKAPDTVGGMTMLNNNGSSVLRRIARTFDDRITEPHICRYYEYLLLHGPDEAKGDFTIDAVGSSSLVERDMQNQQLSQIVGISLNPAYGLDPELVVGEVLKGMKFDLKRLALSDEKKKEMATRQPPPPPQVAVATINQQGATQRQAQLLQATAQQADKDRQIEMLTLHSNEYIEQMKQDGASAETVEQLKAMLAATTLKLRTQEKLSVLDIAHSKDTQVAAHTVDLHKHHSPVITPPTEPVGRAAPGHSFEQ